MQNEVGKKRVGRPATQATSVKPLEAQKKLVDSLSRFTRAHYPTVRATPQVKHGDRGRAWLASPSPSKTEKHALRSRRLV